MPKLRAWSFTGALLLALVGFPVRSEPIALDSARSSAEFEVRVMWMFDIQGRFGAVTGEVDIDHEARSVRVRARIDARVVSMRRSSYEEWVKSDEFFDAARHPYILFESEPFPLAALELGGDIVGNLTLRGVTRPTSLQLRPSECPGAVALSCDVVADGAVQRSDFGMRTRRATLADKVRLHFTVRTVAPPE
jgi:polyisoprenoid-binding protein YceI